ncbi:MAG TPA: lytic transglycosylase F [Myxococcales bacterium]|nr:lytic transglycosylase F [Myxococcales bacterium]
MKAWLPAILCAALALPARAEEAVLEGLSQPFTGDLDAMVQRRVIRALVAPSRTDYWIDRGKQTGAEYELLTKFEDELNRSYAKKRKHVRLHVSFVPTPRDQLIPALLAGRGDIAAALLTVTPERQKEVDFADPFFRSVMEIVVAGPASPPLASLDDLSGKMVFVRKSSSYWTHLAALSDGFVQAGKPPIDLRAAPEDLLDEDVLEMLDAGLIPGVTVSDRYLALLWARVLRRIRPREDLRVHEGGEIAWMVRKENPLLKAEISRFAKKNGQGSGFGNILIRKYAGNSRRVKPATSPGEMKKFQKMAALFRKYGSQYDLDYLLMMAQGYQESRLDQSAKSAAGAIGVMQLLPATGKEMKTGDITQLEPNIHAGVKYIRFVQDRYFQDQPMTAVDKTLFSFAAYNAGPARVAQLRALAGKKGLDPNVWLNNVEVVAAEKIGAETVTYVSNIYKYFVSYKLMSELQAERVRALDSLK